MFQNPFNMPVNPFSFNTMAFKVEAIHNNTGSTKEGVMVMNIPPDATEQNARRIILEMAYQHGWRVSSISRVTDMKDN